MEAAQAVIIEHPVANYEIWKAAFDAHVGVRKEAGFLGHHLNRAADDTDRVTVFFQYSDRAKLDAFLDSDEVKAAMQAAGVTGPPTITFCDPTRDRVVWDRPLPAILVRHEVADYDAWKQVYDTFDSLREQHGIIGDAVNRSGGNGNTVLVYHQAETRASLEALLASAELRAGMADAGVLEPPQVTFLNGGIDAVRYQ